MQSQNRKCAKSQKTANFRGSARKATTGRMRRVNSIDHQRDQSKSSTREDAENVVLHLNGRGTPPFILKEKTNSRHFSKMIDSGSPIAIFSAGDLRKILQHDVIFARPLPKNEEYVDNRPLNLLGFTTADVKVGNQTLKQARFVIAREGKKPFIRRD